MTTLTELHELDLQERLHQEIPRKTPPPPALHAGPGFFSSVLLEVDNTERRRRKWSAFSSLILQSLMLASLLIIPLLFTEALPKAQLLTFLVAPPPPPPPPPPAAAAAAQVIRRVESDMVEGRLRTPTRIPEKVQMIREEEAPPQINGGGVIGGVEGGIPGGQLGGVIGGIINSTSSLSAVPKLAAPAMPRRVRVSSGVVAGMVISKIEPTYPPIARAGRIQGEVVLTAVISKQGTIENLQVESGHPLLIKAALEAVQQWHYRPYFVSGEPVEVETKIVVTFRFGE